MLENDVRRTAHLPTFDRQCGTRKECALDPRKAVLLRLHRRGGEGNVLPEEIDERIGHLRIVARHENKKRRHSM